MASRCAALVWFGCMFGCMLAGVVDVVAGDATADAGATIEVQRHTRAHRNEPEFVITAPRTVRTTHTHTQCCVYLSYLEEKEGTKGRPPTCTHMILTCCSHYNGSHRNWHRTPQPLLLRTLATPKSPCFGHTPTHTLPLQHMHTHTRSTRTTAPPQPTHMRSWKAGPHVLSFCLCFGGWMTA